MISTFKAIAQGERMSKLHEMAVSAASRAGYTPNQLGSTSALKAAIAIVQHDPTNPLKAGTIARLRRMASQASATSAAA